PEGTSLSRACSPNDLWCADYKGEFMLADRRYCYPLTITDSASRYLLSCEALANTKALYAFSVFERVFKDFGLPRAIRTDNGAVSLPRSHRHRDPLWPHLHGAMKINLSQAFAGQKVGVKQVEEKIWLVSFMRYDLGFFDHETCRIESAENPFAAKVLPMSPV